MKISQFLDNIGQSKPTSAMQKFCQNIGEVKTINDLVKIDKAVVAYLKYDPTTPKFSRNVVDIFDSKTYSGCSDVGLFVSVILREKGIPTVYVETADVDWLRTASRDHTEKIPMQGHIFLEVFINDKWYLYDPARRYYYLGYDRDNDNLPGNYRAFSKDLNCNNHGVFSVADERKAALEALKNFNPDDYKEPNYQAISLKR